MTMMALQIEMIPSPNSAESEGSDGCGLGDNVDEEVIVRMRNAGDAFPLDEPVRKLSWGHAVMFSENSWNSLV